MGNGSDGHWPAWGRRSGSVTRRPAKVLGKRGKRGTVRKNPRQGRVKQRHVQRSVGARCPQRGFSSAACSSPRAALAAGSSPQHWLPAGRGPGASPSRAVPSPGSPEARRSPVREPLPHAISPHEVAAALARPPPVPPYSRSSVTQTAQPYLREVRRLRGGRSRAVRVGPRLDSRSGFTTAAARRGRGATEVA